MQQAPVSRQEFSMRNEDVPRGGPEGGENDNPARENAMRNNPSTGGGQSVVQLFQDKFFKIVYRVVPPGGILSGAFNMASSSIGAGILGLPGATNSAGLVLSIIFLAIITFFSVFSMYIIAIALNKTNIPSFEGMARWLFPRGHYALSYWAAFIRCFHGFSGCVAYVICVGDILRPIFEEVHKRQPNNSSVKFLDTTSGNRLLTTLLWLCVMFPLMIPKHVDSLRYASTFAVSFILYFSVAVFIHSCMNGLSDGKNHVKVTDADGDPEDDDRIIFLFRTGNVLLSSIGVFMFAYVCQINAYEVWWDMRPEIRTPWNFMWSALIGMLITGFIYMVIAIFGYLDFGSSIGSKSILLMYNPVNEPQMMVAYIGILVKLCVAYALLGGAARNSIYYLIGWQKRYGSQNAVAQEDQLSEECVNMPISHSQDEDAKHTTAGRAAQVIGEEDTTYIDNIPFVKHLIAVVAFCVASLLCGLFIPKITTVFGFAGAISGGFLAFIFPALFYMYAGGFTVQQEGRLNYYITYLLLICGVIGIVFGLAGTIYNTVSG